MKKCKFDIQGMTCSSCQSHVEKAVKKLDGTKDVNVNLLTNTMRVEFDDEVTNEDNIIQAVVDAGYGATISNESNNIENNKSNNHSENINLENNAVKDNIRSMKKRLIISICFLIPLLFISMHHMFFDWFNIAVPEFIERAFHGDENTIISALTQFLLLLPIIFVNRNYFITGFKRLFKLSPNMDSLIAIGCSASMIYSIYAMYMVSYGLGHSDSELVSRYAMDIYFESAGTILTLITLGKYLETKSKGKTNDAITKLINLAPKTAIILKDGEEVEVLTQDIKVDDILVIKPGSSIPVDGVIVEGASTIDESSITGESVPADKTEGDEVISGTINKNGTIKIKATKVGEDTTLSQIINLVEEASNSKAPISKLADRVSGVFVPIVIIIALTTILVWLCFNQSFEFALTAGIAVLVISCPCALGLATPVAIMVGMGKGAEYGVLMKSADSLEMLHKVDTIVLDKTGTITEGRPHVTDIEIFADSDAEEIETLKYNFLQIAASLENGSEHPLAEAIVEKAKEVGITFGNVENFVSIPGRGVRGTIEKINYFAGNAAFMYQNGVNILVSESRVNELSLEGKTVLYFGAEYVSISGIQKVLVGIIATIDTIKETSYKAIEALKSKKIDIVMLTGDSKIVAEAIGKELGITKIVSEVLPADKEKEISKLQEEGKKVAFVGDGINDSPALVRADVGIAIGSGTDIAIESADIVLIKNDLQDVVTAIELSKATISNIRMNLFWAFFYNIIGIPVAAGALYNAFGIRLNPMLGALAMSLSSVCVVTNALRLRSFKSSLSKANKNQKDENDVDKNMTNEKESNDMETEKIILIYGMHCEHCKMSVEKALTGVAGVTSVNVSLENKNATLKANREVSDDEIIKAITEAGFEVKEIL